MCQEKTSDFRISIGVFGAQGRVGQKLCSLILENFKNFHLQKAYVREITSKLPHKLSDILKISIPEKQDIYVSPCTELSLVSDTEMLPDVIVDFSSAAGAMYLLKTLLQNCEHINFKCPSLIIGTTNLKSEHFELMDLLSKRVSIIYATNFSLGIILLNRIMRDYAKVLNQEFDIEIVETHHNKKLDAPSGTALTLADAISGGLENSKQFVYGRHNVFNKSDTVLKARSKEEIGIHAVRLGGVIGDHSIHCGTNLERLEFTHRALTRDAFVAGVLKSASWIIHKSPKIYSMENVLFD